MSACSAVRSRCSRTRGRQESAANERARAKRQSALGVQVSTESHKANVKMKYPSISSIANFLSVFNGSNHRFTRRNSSTNFQPRNFSANSGQYPRQYSGTSFIRSLKLTVDTCARSTRFACCASLPRVLRQRLRAAELALTERYVIWKRGHTKCRVCCRNKQRVVRVRQVEGAAASSCNHAHYLGTTGI